MSNSEQCGGHEFRLDSVSASLPTLLLMLEDAQLPHVVLQLLYQSLSFTSLSQSAAGHSDHHDQELAILQSAPASDG